MPAQRILLPQWGGHELEIAAYEGEIDWGRDVTRALSLLSIYPSSPVNFVLGQISEPFVHRRKPVPLGNALVIGRILIHDIWSAWIGISCQLIKDNFFYEPAELFVPADWSGFAMANYLVGTRSSPKPLGQWFSFEGLGGPWCTSLQDRPGGRYSSWRAVRFQDWQAQDFRLAVELSVQY